MKSKKTTWKLLMLVLYLLKGIIMIATNSQQRIFIWASLQNQPCTVEIAMDWLCSFVAMFRLDLQNTGVYNTTCNI